MTQDLGTFEDTGTAAFMFATVYIAHNVHVCGYLQIAHIPFMYFGINYVW